MVDDERRALRDVLEDVEPALVGGGDVRDERGVLEIRTVDLVGDGDEAVEVDRTVDAVDVVVVQPEVALEVLDDARGAVRRDLEAYRLPEVALHQLALQRPA